MAGPGCPREFTLAQQAVQLQMSPWVGGRGGCRRNVLRWNFNVRPTVLSRMYALALEYRPSGTPQVCVRSPNLLALADYRRLPHVYTQLPTRLCLYLPGAGEWHRGLSIAATIVPWTYLWLHYFEEWLVSDDWKGGGVHPQPGIRRGRSTARSSINAVGHMQEQSPCRTA
jgi:hypothetical protein